MVFVLNKEMVSYILGSCSQPVGLNPVRGHIPDIYLTVHNSSKITIRK